MISVNETRRLLQSAALTLAAMTAASSAWAAGTLSGTSVENTATVSYDVATIPQAVIESSPTGNSAAGAGNGAPTAFVVDNMVDLLVEEVGGAVTLTTPGFSGAVTTFRVINEGNTAQDYALIADNFAGAVHGNADSVDMSVFNVYVDADGSFDPTGAAPGTGAYETGTDSVQYIDSLAPDQAILVFVVANAPLGALTTDYANVELTATTHDTDPGASVGALTVESTGADSITTVDVVFADANGGDGWEAAQDGYAFQAADLLITKTNVVIEDPFNGTSNPKAVPGAFVEYTITLENNGTIDADNVVISDTLPDQVLALIDRYNGSVDDIEIQPQGGASIFCTFDDTDADGCGLTNLGVDGEGGDLLIDLPGGLTISSTAGSNTITILFQVEIR